MSKRKRIPDLVRYDDGFTPEDWHIGEPTRDGHIRVVDCQDCTIATVWHNVMDPVAWMHGNARLIAEAKRLLYAAKVVLKRFAPGGPEEALDALAAVIRDIHAPGFEEDAC
jgi:hypothetical protein